MTAKDAEELPEVTRKFAATLHRLRDEAGLNRRELERRADLDEGSVAAMEERRYLPRYGELMKIAAVLHFDVADLLDGIRWTPGGNGFEIDRDLERD